MDGASFNPEKPLKFASRVFGPALLVTMDSQARLRCMPDAFKRGHRAGWRRDALSRCRIRSSSKPGWPRCAYDPIVENGTFLILAAGRGRVVRAPACQGRANPISRRHHRCGQGPALGKMPGPFQPDGWRGGYKKKKKRQTKKKTSLPSPESYIFDRSLHFMTRISRAALLNEPGKSPPRLASCVPTAPRAPIRDLRERCPRLLSFLDPTATRRQKKTVPSLSPEGLFCGPRPSTGTVPRSTPSPASKT